MAIKSQFLQDIIDEKKRLLKVKRFFYDTIKERLQDNITTRYRLFEKAVSQAGGPHLIAEIKKASPSKGLIREDFDLLGIARIYQQQGACAISVLTEENFFLGKPEYILKVSEQCQTPLLAKDFFIDEGQIYEARLNGASAILLIAAVLSDTRLKALMRLAHGLDIDCLVEVHDQEELKRALDAGARIIGINNRDLHTFEVDINIALDLIPRVPSGVIIVAESGIRTRQDVEALRAAGAHACLIGETLMSAVDIAGKIREVMGG